MTQRRGPWVNVKFLVHDESGALSISAHRMLSLVVLKADRQRCNWLKIRKKTKDLPNNKTIWWFVLHGDEKELCMLDKDWSKVHLQTSWRLESCYAPLTTDSENAASSSNSPANPNPIECDPNCSLSAVGAVPGTTSKDDSTMPPVHNSTPASTMTASTDIASHQLVPGAWPMKAPPTIQTITTV